MNAIPWWVWVVGGLVVINLVGLVFIYCLGKISTWSDEQIERQFYEMKEQEAIPFYVEEVEYDNEYGNALV